MAEDGEGLKAQDVMTSEVRCVDIKEDLEKALEIMNDLKSFTCPVVDKGKVIGLVSYHDIVNHVASSLRE